MRKDNIECTNHATNITKQIDLNKFTEETQIKLLQLMEDFSKQYSTINWERF